MTGRLLTARQVADRLDVFPGTVLRWIRRGDLPAIRLPGGMLRIAEDALDEWLAAHATDADTLTTETAGRRANAPGPTRTDRRP